MASSLILRFAKPRPLKATLPPARSTPDEVRALLERFIVQRPRDLAPLAAWLRISLAASAPRRRRLRER